MNIRTHKSSRGASASMFRWIAKRQSLLPSVTSLALAMLLIVGLGTQMTSPPPGNGVLIGPGGSRLHIQRTSGPGSSFTPYSPNELWGGGNMAENCLPCNFQAASGEPAGQSLQPGQQVNPATGDFTYSQSLFSVPTTGGSLGVNLVYDSQEAAYLIGCSLGGCGAIPQSWPDFGFGWRADQFPTEATETVSGVTISATVTEPDGAQVSFQDVGIATTCGTGSASSTTSYTVTGSSDNFCAPLRVDAQLGFIDGYTTLYVQGGKEIVTFGEYGLPALEGNIGFSTSAGLIGYHTVLETAGTGTCPARVVSGSILGCYWVSDSASRDLTIAVGYPEADSSNPNAVLMVLDPGASAGLTTNQPYNIYWDQNGLPGGALDEPQLFLSQNDSSIGTFFEWQFDGSVYQENMTYEESLNPADGGENITYYNATEDSGYYYGMVYSTSDHIGPSVTYFTYNDANCGQCLGVDQSIVTSISYPDGEWDQDTYGEGILQKEIYGTDSVYVTIGYNVTYPSGSDPWITEKFTTPAGTTTAYANGVGDIVQLVDANHDTFDSPYNNNNFDEACWSAPVTPGSPPDTCSVGAPVGASTYSYSLTNGELMWAEDPNGYQTRFGYNDSMGICWVAPPTVTAAGSQCGATYASPSGHAPVGSTAYQYDTKGDLVCKYVDFGDSSGQTTAEAIYDIDGEMTASYPPDAFGT